MGDPTRPGDSTGRRIGASTARLTFFEWTDAHIDKIRVITPKEGEKDSGIITPTEHIQKALAYDKAAAKNDDRPTLVYFHWPHEHKSHGDAITDLCTRVLDDERVARWGTLFRCVQLDMGLTEPAFAERIGVEKGPSFVVLDRELKIRARIPASKSPVKLRKALEAALKKFPVYRKVLDLELAKQEKSLAQAKKLEKAGKYDEALELVDEIRFGDLRIGDEFDKARSYGFLLAQKAERHADED